jgi:hypothetical protein
MLIMKRRMIQSAGLFAVKVGLRLRWEPQLVSRHDWTHRTLNAQTGSDTGLKASMNRENTRRITIRVVVELDRINGKCQEVMFTLS